MFTNGIKMKKITQLLGQHVDVIGKKQIDGIGYNVTKYTKRSHATPGTHSFMIKIKTQNSEFLLVIFKIS